ncbi:carbon-nitrogen hydrolase family protein [Puniceibacterium sp. IMCC21224]|uniref:carbon-nitrogen hydrolase family protein n=1 Tax=Puniceibacterium sp. IMCC21224 TaxID=1618204 RepID=UPI00064DAAEF|nr:carbon-nitrogen hydrolase family protein [Puniceibacterium sp. IMCC21224]KMK65448.1 putative amidohydrolase [Puniceibacterium sp. IMCC21224]
MSRAALLQLTSSDDPAQNLAMVTNLVARAVAEGADFVLTPEVTNCVSASRPHQRRILQREGADPTLAGLRDAAARQGVWLLAGSLALKSDPPEERFANRSFLIAPDGSIAARYDKMHMFDVQVSEAETYKESSGYAPGDRAVVADTPLGRIGLTVCYDVRFAYLYRKLAQAGAKILTVPSAFSTATGPAHWEPLLRARAIETGAYVLAPAQVGQHAASDGKQRSTYGHSMAVSPWGEVLLDAGTVPGIHMVDIDLTQVAAARAKIPSLQHDRTFSGPASLK